MRSRPADQFLSKACSACMQLKSRDGFSRNQWDRGGPAIRCVQCIASNRRPHEPVEPDDLAIQAQSAAAGALLSGLEALPSVALRPHSARLAALLASTGGCAEVDAEACLRQRVLAEAAVIQQAVPPLTSRVGLKDAEAETGDDASTPATAALEALSLTAASPSNAARGERKLGRQKAALLGTSSAGPDRGIRLPPPAALMGFARTSPASATQRATAAPLPDGWKEYVDMSSGQSYYQNSSSQVVTWERPVSQASSGAQQATHNSTTAFAFAATPAAPVAAFAFGSTHASTAFAFGAGAALPTDAAVPVFGALPTPACFTFGGSLSTPPATPNPAQPAQLESPVAAVMSSEELLQMIFWHADLLAPQHRDYGLIFGNHKAEPSTWDEKHKAELRRYGDIGPNSYWGKHQRRWSASMLVCKLWHGLNVGERGLQAWTAMETAQHEARVGLNRVAAADQEYPWLYRLCAMSAANQVENLQTAIGESPRATSGGLYSPLGDRLPSERWGMTGLREAVRDLAGFEDDDWEGLEPGEQPSLEQVERWQLESRVRVQALKRHGGGWRKCADASRGDGCLFADPDSHLDSGDIGESDNYEAAILAICLLNAVMAGAVKAAELLLSYSDAIWFVEFNQKGNTAFNAAIEFACNCACLEAPVNGVRAMLSRVRSSAPQNAHVKQTLQEVLHRRVRGSDGSALHLASARGHAPLVRVLLAAGMSRSHLVRKRDDYDRSANRANRKACTAEVWARKRGHARVVELLNHKVTQPNRPVRLAVPTGRGAARQVQVGTLVRFDVRKGFGFIEPDFNSEDEADDDDDDDDDYYCDHEERRGDDVFVHLNTLRAAAQGSRGYPQPNQRLVFRAEQGRQGTKASFVADANDGSYLTLPHTEETASREWSFHSSSY